MNKSEVVMEKQAAQQREEARYTLEKLCENCVELFGITTTTFAGATAALTGNKLYTVAEKKRP